jgi:hypothetical protein
VLFASLKAQIAGTTMVTLRLYLEEIQGDWFGWIEGFAGAYCQGTTPQAVACAAPCALLDYLTWLRSHDMTMALPTGLTDADMHVECVETHPAQRTPEGTEINGFFALDERRVDDSDIELALSLLNYAYADLDKALRAIPPDAWDTAPFGEKSVRAILTHLVETERFYLSVLTRFTPLLARTETAAKPEDVREAFAQEARAVPMNRRADVVPVDGENWSLAKVMRRAVWHVRYHAAQIAARSDASAFLRGVFVDVRLWNRQVRAGAA